MLLFFFFFNDTATTEIYTLSLHDALPISCCPSGQCPRRCCPPCWGSPRWPSRPCRPLARPSCLPARQAGSIFSSRSEEHTSELQSRQYLVCRLLLEKKKNNSSVYSLNDFE